MSLSAQIAVGASRRLAVVAAAVASAGIVVAAVTCAVRWPAAVVPIVAAAAVATSLLLWRCVRADRTALRYTLSVSDCSQVAVFPDAESGVGETWRLTDSTMMWPRFSVLALRRDDDALQGSRSVRLALFDSELSTIDRRSLHRFLLWSLRGGDGKGSSSSKNTPS